MNLEQVIALILEERENYDRLSTMCHEAHRTGLGIQYDGARLACDELVERLKEGN